MHLHHQQKSVRRFTAKDNLQNYLNWPESARELLAEHEEPY
jgi:hypothetical protein